MKAQGQQTKDEALLTNVAESIGSTLGTIAAKVSATQKAITGGSVKRAVKRQSRKVLGKARSTARKARSVASRSLRKSKNRKTVRRGRSPRAKARSRKPARARS